MLDDRWRITEDLFHRAVELPLSEREKFLSEICGGDVELRAEVESLLAADEAPLDDIELAVKSGAAHIIDAGSLLGARLGGYRVVSEVGRGGMGTVYMAVRDDDQFSRQVAIKVVKRGMDTADVLSRFRRERQILADLDHPYIARILDGGSTGDGRPYFAMDYVAGLPLDQYLKEKQPGIRERCELFLRICEAVRYAHSKMILHLDLKPANIFVTAEGLPKLLDFGVSKLLSPDMDTTATSHVRPFTPDYSSPEQMQGQAVSTATDVYALGTILYELLSGARAHQFADGSYRELERVVCQDDPKRLGAATRGLPRAMAADLEAITAKALRKEPGQRYPSVEQFAADVERCWNGQPVLAREGSRGYKTKKFLRRNWKMLTAATVIAAALIATTALALVQARRASEQQRLAEQQRQRAEQQQQLAERQRQLAEQQRQMALESQGREATSRKLAEMEAIQARRQQAIAERRFDVARDLGRKLSLDMIETLRALPGATAVRKNIIETGLRYFNALMQDAEGNPELMKEIGRGYELLGNVQGNYHYSNLGDAAGALESYRKSLAIRESIVDPSPRFLAERVRLRIRMSEILAASGEGNEAERLLLEAVRLAEASKEARHRLVRIAVADAYSALGESATQIGRFDSGAAYYGKTLEICSELEKVRRPEEASVELCISIVNHHLGSTFLRLRRDAEALSHAQASLAINQRILARDPSNAVQIDRVLGNYNVLSTIYHANPSLATSEEIKKIIDAMVAMSDRALAVDTQDSRAMYQVMIAQIGLGDWHRTHNDLPGSMKPYRRAVEMIEKFAATRTPALFTYEGLMVAHQRLATALARSGELQEAMVELDLCAGIAEKAERLAPGSLSLAARKGYISRVRGIAYSVKKMWPEAKRQYEISIEAFDALRLRDPKNLWYLNEVATALPELSFVYETLGQRQQATEATKRSLQLLEEIAAQRALDPEEQQKRTEGLAKLAEWAAR